MLAGFMSTAFAVDTTISLTGMKDRPTNTHGSLVRLAVHNGVINYGLQTETVGGTSRNQADVSYTLVDAVGISASVGLGEVTKTNTKTHTIYLGKIGYTYDYGNKFSSNVGLSYRNDFDSLILDRKLDAKVGGAYALTAKSSVGLTYSHSYGDSKKNAITLAYNTKF